MIKKSVFSRLFFLLLLVTIFCADSYSQNEQQKKTKADFIIQEIFSNNPETREKTLASLASYDAKEIFLLLKPYCESKQPEIRIYALAALEVLKSKESYEEIAKMLKDKSPSVAYTAALALARNISISKDSIRDAIQSSSSQAQYYALVAIEKSKDKAFWDSVIFLANSSFPQVRRQAVFVLGSYQGEKADTRFSETIHILRRRLSDGDRLVRASAIWSLSQHDYEEKQKDIEKSAMDSAWEVRCAAVNSITTKEKKEDISRLLLSLIKDTHWAVRYASVKKAGKLNCLSLLPTLHEMLLDKKETEKVKAAVCSALGELGDISSLPFLLQSWQSPSMSICKETDFALSTFAYLYPRKFVQIFQDKSQPWKLRCDVAMLLGRIQAKDMASYLYVIAQDKEEQETIRCKALLLLADFEGSKAMPLFQNFLKSDNPYLQEAAVLALGKIKDESHLKEIFSFLGSSHIPLREASIWAISQLDFLKTQPLLLEALKSQDEKTSQAADLLLRITRFHRRDAEYAEKREE